MAELPDDPNAGRGPDLPEGPLGDRVADEGISELQARLNELQRSVELLGTQGVWTSGAEVRDTPPPARPPHNPPPVPAPVPGPSAGETGPDRFGEEPGISDPEASVAMVDAGPFADLIELRHFEDDLSSLAAVSDVRVRRFGQGRAMIEVGMAGPYELSRELPRLGLPMDVDPVGRNELIIEFAPLPTHGPDVEAPVGAGDDGQGGD